MIIQQFSHILNWGVFISASNMSLSLDFIRTIADGDYTQGNSICIDGITALKSHQYWWYIILV